MNCRIDIPRGELVRYSPNLDHLVELVSDMVPHRLRGILLFTSGPGGMKIEFVGDGAWQGFQSSCDEIPRWMFCELAFRKLLDARVASFIDILDELGPMNGGADQPGEEFGISPRWSLG